METELIKLTQQGLNALVGARLPITGNYFGMTTAAAEKLKAALKGILVKKGYYWGTDQLIAVRMDDVLTNEFTDWGIIVLPNGSARLFPMSTKPGLLYMKQRDTLGGIVCEGQYDSHILQGAWWSGAEFALQTGPVSFYRDVDLDGVITRGKVYTATNTGFNIHTYKNTKSGWLWNMNKVSDAAAGVLSRGCQVMQYNVHSMVWAYIKQIGQQRGNRLRYTLIHLKDF